MDKARLELWVIEAQSGCEKSFEKLCRHYHPALLRFSFKICGDENIARDAVQNSWMKLTKTLRRLQDPRAFKSWVYRLVRWQTLDIVKRSSNEFIEFTSTELNDEIYVEHEEESIDTEDKLKTLLTSLSELDKQVIHLFYLEEMRLVEIAHVLEVPVGTIKSRLNRARNNLKAQLNNQEKRL